jgi:hypothetical protein
MPLIFQWSWSPSSQVSCIRYNHTIKTYAPLFPGGQDLDRPETEPDITKPPSAVSSDGDQTTKAVRSLIQGSLEDKLAMAKQLLAVMETDELKNRSQQSWEAPPLKQGMSMVSSLQSAIQQWHALGLLQQNH